MKYWKIKPSKRKKQFKTNRLQRSSGKLWKVITRKQEQKKKKKKTKGKNINNSMKRQNCNRPFWDKEKIHFFAKKCNFLNFNLIIF